MYVEKTKALISCAVIAQLICAFLHNARNRFLFMVIELPI